MSSVDKTGGELSLSKLLGTLKAVLHEPTYVFITLPVTTPISDLSEVRLFFRESEGITVILTREAAIAQGYDFTYESKMITLDVHSSLEAVGFMAAIATRLATKAISVNPVSGFYHDHLFVPVGREQETMQLLEELAKENA